MTVRTHVFTRRDGTQVLLCIYPDGRLTIADRDEVDGTWGPPIQEDTYYADLDVRPVHEITALVQSEFGEAL